MKYGAPGRASGLERGRTTEHGKAGGANALAPQPEHLYVPSAPREQTRGVPQSPNPWDRAPSPWAAQRTGAMANGPDPHKGRMRKEGGLVHHLKSKGVKFDPMSETEAEKYLRENNNLFRLGSRRVVSPSTSAGRTTASTQTSTSPCSSTSPSSTRALATSFCPQRSTRALPQGAPPR